MGEVFKINRTSPYSLRILNEFSSRVPKKIKCGRETISFLAWKAWALVQGKIKECSFLEAFKSKSGNINQIVEVGYERPTCNMLLVFFKYAQMCISLQMQIFYIHIM